MLSGHSISYRRGFLALNVAVTLVLCLAEAEPVTKRDSAAEILKIPQEVSGDCDENVSTER